MTKEKIQKVKTETVRFVEKMDAYEKRLSENTYAYLGCKESGAVRRASMDLTRALADLRKP